MAEILYGRWNPSQVRDRIVDDTWTTVEVVSGMQKIVPSSIDFSGSYANLDPSTGYISFNNVSFLRINGLFSNSYTRYSLLHSLRGNVFEGINIRCQVTQSAGDYNTSSGYHWTYRKVYNSTATLGGDTSDPSWLFDQVNQYSYKAVANFYSPSSEQATFINSGVWNYNPEVDYNVGQAEYFGYTTANVTPVGLKFFPQNNLEFMSGTMVFYAYI